MRGNGRVSVCLSCPHQPNKITVLEIDLTIFSYLTAFLEERTVFLLPECCTATYIEFYNYILALRFVLFLCTVQLRFDSLQ